MGKMKRLLVIVVILAVIVAMALRGCPRIRKTTGVAHDSATASVTGIARTHEHNSQPS
jgi:hypothetical protein